MILKVTFILIAVSFPVFPRLIASSRTPRLSLAEPAPSYYYTNINGVPGTYAFGYETLDPESGVVQFRVEERYPNGTVVGSYGYTDTLGQHHHYKYIADQKGYRVKQVKQRPRDRDFLISN